MLLSTGKLAVFSEFSLFL